MTQRDPSHPYWTHGFASGMQAMTAEEAHGFLAELQDIEATQDALYDDGWTTRDYRPWDHPDHPLADWAMSIVMHPGVRAVASSILGPELLVRNADVFVKNPKTRRGIGWHQDTAEQGSETDGMMTMWLGLTASTVENGCLKFIPGSHIGEIPHGPKDKFTLTLNQQALAHLDVANAAFNVMTPGQCSAHHIRMVHASDANRTRERRVGFVIRWMTPEVSAAVCESGTAYVAQGSRTGPGIQAKPHFPMTWTG